MTDLLDLFVNTGKSKKADLCRTVSELTANDLDWVPMYDIARSKLVTEQTLHIMLSEAKFCLSRSIADLRIPCVSSWLTIGANWPLGRGTRRGNSALVSLILCCWSGGEQFA